MSNYKNIQSFFNISIVRHLLFWTAVFTYFIITIEIKYFSSYQEAIEARTILISMQIITAYTCLSVLIPRYLNPKKNIQFTIGLLLLLASVYTLFVCIMEFYYQPKYFDGKDLLSDYNSKEQFWKYIFNFPMFMGKSVKFLTPTILIVIAKFYKNQQKYLQLNEQKKTTELAVLKHQLNPHFLFNTLNNLYALSIKKSDEAPEVIAKLSEMLDYMLYGCNEKYVALHKEMELIENYLALEKVRYGKRVIIEFNKNVEKDVKIAPLILLTFIENAFKHGVSQELKEAQIHIQITLKGHYIYFEILNSIAKNKAPSNKPSIGLNNVKQQLELLYAGDYTLDITEKKDNFNVRLKLPAK
ncbi:MAG: sensor histidine kinase [Flavobacteriaceae bacterium]|nr:sensor histidine kinase [Flavobacteriaceae bacterium]